MSLYVVRKTFVYTQKVEAETSQEAKERASGLFGWDEKETLTERKVKNGENTRSS